MLRMYVAQQCFGLSDEGAEDALYDSQAIRRFVGVDLSRETAPDATTLLNFRHLLETHQLTKSIFNTINAHLARERPVSAGRHHRRCHADCSGALNQEQGREAGW